MILVLLPGLDGTGDLFKPLLDALPDDMNTLVISYPTDIKLNYDELIELVLSQLPNKNFILLAESFSGYVAYQVALRQPQHLISVVLTATFIDNPRPFLLRMSKFLPCRFLFSLPIPTLICKFLLLGFTVNHKTVELFQQTLKQVSSDVLTYRLREIAKLTKDLLPVNLKVTYIQATKDKLVPARCLSSFQKLFANLTVVPIEGPHLILQSHPHDCAEVVVNQIRLGMFDR